MHPKHVLLILLFGSTLNTGCTRYTLPGYICFDPREASEGNIYSLRHVGTYDPLTSQCDPESGEVVTKVDTSVAAYIGEEIIFKKYGTTWVKHICDRCTDQTEPRVVRYKLTYGPSGIIEDWGY